MTLNISKRHSETRHDRETKMNKFERCEPEDPDRCQAVGKEDQCPYLSLQGSKFCPRHGGNRAHNSQASVNLRNLRLTRVHAYTERAKELGESENIKSIRDEIGIARLLLEERLATCETPTDLMLHSPVINDSLLKIEKLVSSAHRLESNLGELLDKSAVVQLTGELVEIISSALQDLTDTLIDELGNEYKDKITAAISGKIVDKICDQIAQATVQAGRKQDG